MYIDDSIELREDLPQKLLDDFIILEEYYKADDWFNFDIYFESVEATTKACYLAGKIDREDLEKIFRKYGIA